MKENDKKLILKNVEKFKILHQKRDFKLMSLNKHMDLVIVPVTINICINSLKYKIDFIKYAKYIIDTLNDGFSGKSYSPYKNINNEPSFKYNIEYIKKILDTQKDFNSHKNAEIIYNFINASTDTKIRFYLHSIVYHDVFIDEKFENNDTEKFIEVISKLGFKILESHRKNLNVNIIKFNCSTLGVSIFPWMKYISKRISSCMQVFLDFCTIHPDIADNKFNNCKTLIHEVGHIFGLRHSFSCNKETLETYSILLGKNIVQKEILDKINLINKKDLNNTKNLKEIIKKQIDTSELLFFKDKSINSEENIQLYPDVPTQIKSTNHNPFDIETFPVYKNIPSDFACFMDYSPDIVLTHFTESQSKIMHYMIHLFKSYLIKKSKDESSNLNNRRVKLYIHKKSNIINPILNILLDDTTQKYYITYENTSFKYSVQEVDDKFKGFIYREK